MTDAAHALDRFMERALEIQPQGYFKAPFDPDWRSTCELDHEEGDEQCRWRPVRQPQPVDFAGLENALEFPIHPDIKTFYGRYWAGAIDAKSTEGHVSLIQLWNYDDYERLIANLIGHALAKRKLKARFSVFFATTEPDSELFLSIDNESGAVMLEEPGKLSLREVETEIATFLDRLTPLDTPPEIY